MTTDQADWRLLNYDGYGEMLNGKEFELKTFHGKARMTTSIAFSVGRRSPTQREAATMRKGIVVTMRRQNNSTGSVSAVLMRFKCVLPGKRKTAKLRITTYPS